MIKLVLISHKRTNKSKEAVYKWLFVEGAPQLFGLGDNFGFTLTDFFLPFINIIIIVKLFLYWLGLSLYGIKVGLMVVNIIYCGLKTYAGGRHRTHSCYCQEK